MSEALAGNKLAEVGDMKGAVRKIRVLNRGKVMYVTRIPIKPSEKPPQKETPTAGGDQR